MGCDLNGLDVTNDSKWQCYNDNRYNFKKSSIVAYDTRAKRCDIDNTLLSSNISVIYQPFEIFSENEDFNNPGKITLVFKDDDSGSEIYSMEIRFSDFDKAIFRVSNSLGEKADLHLITS